MRRLTILASFFVSAVLAASVWASAKAWPGCPALLPLPAMLLVNALLLKAVLFRASSSPPGQRRGLAAANRVIRILLWTCVLVACGLCLELAWGGLFRLREALLNPMPQNAMEGRETVKAWLLAQGRNIYPSMQAHPFLVTIYPPVYHAAIALAGAVAGWSIGAGRLVSLISFWGLGLLAGWLTWRAAGSLLAAFAVTALLLFDPTLSEWSLHARPDMLAWFFALAGACAFLAAFECAAPRGQVRWSLAAGVLFCLAFFTKQQTLPFFLGSLVWAAGKGRTGWRLGGFMAAATVFLGALLAVSLEIASGGGFLRDTLWYPMAMGALPSVTTSDNLLVRLGQVWDRFRVLWCLWAFFLAWSVWRRKWILPLALGLVNVLFMAKLLASWGADINYAFGLVLSALLSVGYLLAGLARTRPYGRAGVLLLLLACLPRALATHEVSSQDVAALQSLRGRILVNTEGGHLFIGDKAGRETVFFDCIESQLYEASGFWKSEESILIRDISGRTFDSLVFYGDFMPRKVLDAVNIFYRETQQLGHYAVYTPQGAGIIAALNVSGQWIVSGEVQAGSAGLSSLSAETEGFAPLDRSKPGVLLLRLDGPRPLGRTTISFAVRLDPKDPGSAATYALRDGQGRILSEGAAARKGVSSFDVPAETSGNSLELTLELHGNAWVSAVNGTLAVWNANQ